MKPIYLSLLTLFSLASVNFAEEQVSDAKAPDLEKKHAETMEADCTEPCDDLSITTHSGTFGGETIKYTATAGTMVISKKEEDPKAKIFYVAYTRDGVEDPSTRPIVYCFNGGPGSSAVWLHLGGLGPKRVQMMPDGTMPAPPFRIGDNPDSILRVADLVFIDPVSTGFSRADDKEKSGEFHGMKGDLDSMAEFIRLYTTRNGRWLSPKFLAGESYGAFRAAGLSLVLLEDFGLYLNGVVLVSGVLDFQTLRKSELSYVTFLPALSEVAAWHGKLEKRLLKNPEVRRKEVEAFASGPYAVALLKGRLGENEKLSLAEQISRYIGIDVEDVLNHNLRISPRFFREELLKEDRLVLGRFDARITGRDGIHSAIEPEYDPSSSAVFGPFSAAQNDYLRRELNYESDLVYEVLSDRVHPWKFGDEFVGKTITVAPELSWAIVENPAMKVLITCGYQDLATPATAMKHSIDHMELDPELFENIQYTYYEGGHMMYTIESSNSAWNQDIAEFIQENSNIQ